MKSLAETIEKSPKVLEKDCGEKVTEQRGKRKTWYIWREKIPGILKKQPLQMEETVTCKSWDWAPAAMAIGGNVVDELLIFLRRPQPSLHLLLVAAWMMPHLSLSTNAANPGSVTLLHHTSKDHKRKKLFSFRDPVERKMWRKQWEILMMIWNSEVNLMRERAVPSWWPS